MTVEAEVGRVSVKALEWVRDYGRRVWYGNVVEDTGRGYTVKDNGIWCTGTGPWVLDQAGDLEAAKAACQADYERRIRSALVYHQSPSLDTGGGSDAGRAALEAKP